MHPTRPPTHMRCLYTHLKSGPNGACTSRMLKYSAAFQYAACAEGPTTISGRVTPRLAAMQSRAALTASRMLSVPPAGCQNTHTQALARKQYYTTVVPTGKAEDSAFRLATSAVLLPYHQLQSYKWVFFATGTHGVLHRQVEREREVGGRGKRERYHNICRGAQRQPLLVYEASTCKQQP